MTFFIHTADNSLLHLLFLKSVSILSGCPITNVRCCHEDTKLSCIGPCAYHPRTGFRYCKLLTHLLYDCGSFSNISGMDLDVCGYRKCLIFMHIRHMVRLFELWCQYNLIRRKFKKRNLCICCIFCIYGLLCINPLSEFCNIHLNFTAVVRHHEVYWE
jgi:hypothetical protein